MNCDLRIKEYVPASQIWPRQKDYTDFGAKPGLLRGYNIEVTNKKGVTDWMTAEFIYGEPETELNADWCRFFREDMDLVPTGRICFRGYYTEEYDPEERDTFVVPATVTE